MSAEAIRIFHSRVHCAPLRAQPRPLLLRLPEHECSHVLQVLAGGCVGGCGGSCWGLW